MKKLCSLPELIMLSLTFLFCIYGTGFVERVSVNEGAGWDGNGYVYYASELPRLLEEREIDKYYFSRFFPSVSVRGIMEVYALVKGVSVSALSKATVVNCFALWTAFCLFSAIVLLLNIFREYDAKVRWGLWLLLIGNFFILKMTFFYPTLTDITAFFLASLMLWTYKRNYYIIMLVVCILGYFTHPLLFYIGMLLWVFREPNKNKTSFVSKKWNWPVIGVVLILVLIKLILVTYVPLEHVRKTTTVLLPLSIALILVYLGVLLYALNPVRKIQELLNGIHVKRLLGCLATWGILSFLTQRYSNGQEGMGFREFMHFVLYDAMLDPLIFAVANVVYFGPAVLLLIFFFPVVKNKMEQESLGLQFVFWVGLLLSINSESRQMVIFWPLMIYALSDVVKEKIAVKKYLLLIIGSVALIWSKVWLNLQPSAYALTETKDFPEQFYFMNHGPWMNHQMYLLQLVATLLMAALIYAAIKFLPSTVQRMPDSAC